MPLTQDKLKHLEELCRLVRYFIIESTSRAGSGHPSSSLSAVELMVCLFFEGFLRYDPDRPGHPNNDRVIFSKGHASPLLYSLYAAAGRVSENELLAMRSFQSPLEGHPTPAFAYTEAATGSLGQGLSIGLGMALNGRYLDRLPYTTYVLLGDSEMSEGSQWEAIQIAAYYRLDNLVAVLDVNRLGQRGQTMYGHDLEAYRRRLEAFGWEVLMVDGHSLPDIAAAYAEAGQIADRPAAILARTIKGKGVANIEDQNGWHGKALKGQDYRAALDGLGRVDTSLQGSISLPQDLEPAARQTNRPLSPPVFSEAVSTREAYGKSLSALFAKRPDLVALDGEVSNSTHAAEVKEHFPERFFEMFVAEQNMAGAALGLGLRGKTPFVSTFAAFFTRTFDQLRMGQYSGGNLKCVGSHAGVSIGQDGSSQMGLEDLAMFRSLFGSVVLYPCDGPSTARLVEEAAGHDGLVYIRTSRGKTPVIYGPEEPFPIGGCKVLCRSEADLFTVCASGITVHEALKAAQTLEKEGLKVRVVDLYSVKPLDRQTLLRAGHETGGLIVVEDHYPEGGIGEAVASTLSATSIPVYSLAVTRLPRSGKPEELLDFEGISQRAIVDKVRELSEN
ncbi:MAG: transketolase [Desulfohalobiaceae bacterium]|nr:transketolase [Desulfohalobiaceae bacterium]